MEAAPVIMATASPTTAAAMWFPDQINIVNYGRKFVQMVPDGEGPAQQKLPVRRLWGCAERNAVSERSEVTTMT